MLHSRSSRSQTTAPPLSTTKDNSSSLFKIALKTHTTSSSSSSSLSSSPTAATTTINPSHSLSLLASPVLPNSKSISRTNSSVSLHSNSSATALINDSDSRQTSVGSRETTLCSHKINIYHQHQHHQQHRQQHHCQHQQHSSSHHTHFMQHNRNNHYVGSGVGGAGASSRKSSTASSSSAFKRGKKSNWGSRERAGMSFLIVIAFFAVFGLIILTELFMIDEKTHGGMMVLRHGSQGNRLGDSMPDYDNVKDDYDLLDDSLLNDNKLGFIQFQDNQLKIQEASKGDAGRSQAAGILLNSAANPGYGSVNVPIIPWGRVLPNQIEETLPHYPIGVEPTDGSWQVVNGTRFKFFVFSAFYDRRDGARLVRVVGATKTRGPERVWCRFWYTARRNETETKAWRYISATVMARVKTIRENWNLKYSACFVLCPIRSPDLDVPQYVSVVSRLRAPPGNILTLRNTDWDTDFMTKRSIHAGNSSGVGVVAAAAAGSSSSAVLAASSASSSSSSSNAAASASTQFSPLPSGDQIADKVAICVKPFHFNYDQALYLMEYLEFYALMGVAHFTFYNHTIGPHATCVLQHYISGDVPDASTAWDFEYDAAANGSAAVASKDKVEEPQKQQRQQKFKEGKQQQQQQQPAEQKQQQQHQERKYQTTQKQSHYTRQQTQQQRQQQQQLRQPQNHLKNDDDDNQVEQQQQQHQQPAKRQLRHITTNYVKPTINILPWNLRMRSQKEIRTEGLFAALNDCLYRTMYRYRYLALVDLDEFIIPRHNDTLNELMHSLNQRFHNRNTGAYSFQNAFFYLQFADDPFVLQEPEKGLNPRLRAALVTQRKTRRRFKLHPQKQRSKYICKPEAVIEAGNHFVWEFLPGRGSLNVPPTDAILQHYRVCEFGGNDCIKAPSIVDRTATKYLNRLLQRVNAVYEYLKVPCKLPDLPPLPKPPASASSSSSARPQKLKQKQKVATTKTTITKIFNDFKTKLKVKLNTSLNEGKNAIRTTTATMISRKDEAAAAAVAALALAAAPSNEASTDQSHESDYEDMNKIVVFEKDADGKTVVKVKYGEI